MKDHRDLETWPFSHDHFTNEKAYSFNTVVLANT